MSSENPKEGKGNFSQMTACTETKMYGFGIHYCQRKKVERVEKRQMDKS